VNKKYKIISFAVAAVVALGCTVGPKDMDGNPIPTGPNPSVEPDHPPVPETPKLPKSVHIINLIVTSNQGPVTITGTIAGARRNGPPSQPIAARIGSAGGSWKGYVPYAPGTKVGVYLRAEYKGPPEYVETLQLLCEANEERVAPNVKINLKGSRVVSCLWDSTK
jgi:hypothetical protein